MNRFKIERLRNGYNFTTLGKKLGVSSTTISNYEKGIQGITPVSFKKLRDIGFDERALINPTAPCGIE